MVGVPRLFLIDSFGFIFRAYHARARSGAPQPGHAREVELMSLPHSLHLMSAIGNAFQA